MLTLSCFRNNDFTWDYFGCEKFILSQDFLELLYSCYRYFELNIFEGVCFSFFEYYSIDRLSRY